MIKRVVTTVQGDVPNLYGIVFPTEVLEKAIVAFNEKCKDHGVLGCTDPDPLGTTTPLDRVTHSIRAAGLDENNRMCFDIEEIEELQAKVGTAKRATNTCMLGNVDEDRKASDVTILRLDFVTE